MHLLVIGLNIAALIKFTQQRVTLPTQFKAINNHYIVTSNNIEEVTRMICPTCCKDLEEGSNAIGIEEGVIGRRGFVPLEETLIVCSKQCLRVYFANNNHYERNP